MDKVLLEKGSIQIDCIKHPNNRVIFVQTKEISNDKKLFYCLECVYDEEDSFNTQNYVVIDKIQVRNDNQIINKWPPNLDNSLHKKIQQYTQDNNQQKLLDQVDSFFENLKQDIIKKIDQVKKQMINDSQQNSNYSNEISQVYQELSKSKIFKEILLDLNIDSQKKQKQLKDLISEFESQKQQTTEKFNQVILKYEQNQNIIDFKAPENIKSSIIELIDKINMFPQEMNQMKNLTEIKQIMSVLRLKSNYLRQDFLIQFEKYLMETYPLFNKVKFDTIFLENQKIQAFQQISDETLNNMTQLMVKINEIQNGNNVGEESQRIKQYCSTLQKQYYFDEDLDKLYQNYPIFDLLNPHKQIDILSQIQMIKANYHDNFTQYLKIVKNEQNNQISISNNHNNGVWLNCVSDFILDRNTNYVFRFQFINNSQTDKRVTIGLMRDSQKDSQTGYLDNLSCQFYINQNTFYSDGFGIDKKEKGDFSVLRCDQVIEMRVNIKKQILQMLDYPNYNHILSITDQHKNKLQKYKNLRLNITNVNTDLNINMIYAYKNK